MVRTPTRPEVAQPVRVILVVRSICREERIPVVAAGLVGLEVKAFPA